MRLASKQGQLGPQATFARRRKIDSSNPRVEFGLPTRPLYRGTIALRPYRPAARVDLQVRVAAFFPPETPRRQWGEPT